MAYYRNLISHWIPPGTPGTRYTLEVMQRLARAAAMVPAVQYLAQNLRDPQGVDDFLRQYWRIVPDPLEAEYIRAPTNQLKFWADKHYLEGDCDDSAVLAGALLAAMPWPASFVAIRLP